MKPPPDSETVLAVHRPATQRAFGYLFVCLLILAAMVVVRVCMDEAQLILSALAAISSMSWLAAFVHALQAWREPEEGRFGKFPFGSVLCFFTLAIVAAGTYFALTAFE